MSQYVSIEASIKLDVYKIIRESIDKSIDHGWNRAHKYTEIPGIDHIKEELLNSIMNDLCQIIKFDENI